VYELFKFVQVLKAAADSLKKLKGDSANRASGKKRKSEHGIGEREEGDGKGFQGILHSI
jgi:hypothetical protein